MAAPLSVAVVGARRVRQGTGPFHARMFAEAGAEVCAVLCTSADTAQEARESLREQAAIKVRAYEDFTRLLKKEKPEVVVVASPAETHRAYLEGALEAGVHVLCEKPLLDSPPSSGREDAAAAERLAAGFAKKGLVLSEACQWPLTLEFFRGLHPRLELTGVKELEMSLAPARRGRECLTEALSHVLSLAQAVAPGEMELRELRFLEAGPEAARVRLAFVLVAGGGRRLACRFTAEDTGEVPRPAHYALDGLICRRRIEEPGYQVAFDNGLPEDSPDYRRMPAEDPMLLKVRAFLERVRSAQAGRRKPMPPESALVQRQALFSRIIAAHDDR